jgi:hypothetical protein
MLVEAFGNYRDLRDSTGAGAFEVAVAVAVQVPVERAVTAMPEVAMAK